jgi:Na+/H+ antiporter NhaD/arsenite permease-like protein
MIAIIVTIFVLGYLGIAFEHPLKINKAATALLTGVLLWTLGVMLQGETEAHNFVHSLGHHLEEIAQILFFLLGAMTIVEVVDAHKGFDLITNRITTKSVSKLFWIIGFVTFFLSSVLDNLTTTIVMVYLLRKLVKEQELRWVFVSFVVIAANAGGAWSPIGDVTTTMLWIGGQISAMNIIKTLILPSLVCMVIPAAIFAMQYGKQTLSFQNVSHAQQEKNERVHGSTLMFFLGVGGLIFVPIFKTVTHLPPFMGMMMSLAVVWIVSEIIHRGKSHEEKHQFSAVHALQKIDAPSILFFLGILLAVGALQVLGVLGNLASWLDSTVGNKDIIASLIGVLSAIIDNVPQVAAAMGMYPLATEVVNPEAFQFALQNPQLIHEGAFLFNGKEYFLHDAKLWEAIAYAAGTGGSMLIIGSAAGVAAMGLEGISFGWFLKKISWIAAVGFIAGYLTYLAVYPMLAVH